jgi:hypothetical protein
MFKFIPNSFHAFLIYSFCLLLLLGLLSNSVYANIDEVTLTPHIKEPLDKQKFIPIGETTFTVLFWDIYSSQLLTTSGSYPVKNTNDNLLFDIHYLRDITSEDLIKRTVEQWQHLGTTEEKYQRYLPILQRLWPNIKDGDSLSLLIYQGRSVFYFNNQYQGVIDDPEFGEIFLAIWLSDRTSQPRLRNELLGLISKDIS